MSFKKRDIVRSRDLLPWHNPARFLLESTAREWSRHFENTTYKRVGDFYQILATFEGREYWVSNHGKLIQIEEES